jgi:hypothetical protein
MEGAGSNSLHWWRRRTAPISGQAKQLILLAKYESPHRRASIGAPGIEPSGHARLVRLRGANEAMSKPVEEQRYEVNGDLFAARV